MSFANMKKFSPEYLNKKESTIEFLNKIVEEKKHRCLFLNEIKTISDGICFLNNNYEVTDELMGKITELKDDGFKSVMLFLLKNDNKLFFENFLNYCKDNGVEHENLYQFIIFKEYLDPKFYKKHKNSFLKMINKDNCLYFANIALNIKNIKVVEDIVNYSYKNNYINFNIVDRILIKDNNHINLKEIDNKVMVSDSLYFKIISNNFSKEENFLNSFMKNEYNFKENNYNFFLNINIQLIDKKNLIEKEMFYNIFPKNYFYNEEEDSIYSNFSIHDFNNFFKNDIKIDMLNLRTFLYKENYIYSNMLIESISKEEKDLDFFNIFSKEDLKYFFEKDNVPDEIKDFLIFISISNAVDNLNLKINNRIKFKRLDRY